MKKSYLLAILLSALLILSGCATAEVAVAPAPAAPVVVEEPAAPVVVEAQPAPEAPAQVFEAGIAEIEKYGNIDLDIPAETLLDAGFEFGDLVKVEVNGHELSLPFCTDYSDVDTGSLLIRVKGSQVIVAINMGDFAKTYGIAVKEKHEDKTYTWIYPEGKDITSYKFALSLEEKGGYKDQYLIHKLQRTNERADYATDAIFANFREVRSGALGAGALFRTSSPINNKLGRAAFADALARENGVQAVMNLADDGGAIEGYRAAEDFASPYYYGLWQEGKVEALNLGVDFQAEEFKAGLAGGLRFFATHEGPYLVHCTEGKDRAGFTSALLASFMGATYDEVVDDYMASYENYYHIEKGGEQWIAVRDSNIAKQLEIITGSATPQTADLAQAAEAYIRGIGLTDAEIEALRANLAKDYK